MFHYRAMIDPFILTRHYIHYPMQIFRDRNNVFVRIFAQIVRKIFQFFDNIKQLLIRKKAKKFIDPIFFAG